MNAGTELLALGIAAVFVERVVEHFVKPWLPSRFIVAASLLLGLGVAFAYHIDVMASLSERLAAPASFQWAAYVFSGLVIGGGSNFVSDLIGRVNGSNGTTA